MNNIKNLWKENKKLVILYGIGIFFGLLIIILLITVLMNFFKTYNYTELENHMVEQTKKYLKANPNSIPKNEEEIIIESSTLITEKYLKDFAKLIKKDTNCSGKIKVSNTNEKLRYTPTLECSNYQTKTIKDYIIDKEELVTKNDGLYLLNEKYTYRGEYVNNYLNFAGFSCRILKFDEEQIQVELSNTINGK